MDAADITTARREWVVLLHGLGRNPLAMKRIEWALRRDGYTVFNLKYASRRHDIATLATRTLHQAFSDAAAAQTVVHIVTHSMGGILVRQYLHDHPAPPELGRIVMLAPPNHGSEIVDRLRGWSLYRKLNGPAGLQLGTDADSVPNRLGPVSSPVGVIAGDRSLNPLFSAWIGGPNDGKVSVKSSRVDGMHAHVTLPTSHTWMMWRTEVVAQTRAFLRDGKFKPSAPRAGSE